MLNEGTQRWLTRSCPGGIETNTAKSHLLQAGQFRQVAIVKANKTRRWQASPLDLAETTVGRPGNEATMLVVSGGR